MVIKNDRKYKDSDPRVSKEVDFYPNHHADLCDQINVLQKAVANARGDNLLKIATVSNELDKILQNFKDPVSLQCKRCGHEWVYHGKNPFRVRCTYCGTTVMVRTSRVDT